MNHIYRTIWNQKTGTSIAVSELAKSSSKKASAVCGEAAGVGAGRGFTLKTMAASLLMATAAPLYALPTDGVVTAGSATISSAGDNMTINQSSPNVALNWQSFSIGQSEAVRFVQPNSNSVALNRVLGPDPSGILGSLSANGQVFLVNPNGILFGQGASVNVGGLVASTQNISDSDFMAGDYNFAGSSNAAVLNQGQINADGGYVALLGRNVANHGVITARMGTVALAAGEAITLDMIGDGLFNVSIDQGAVNALVANGGLIQTDGGQVLMSAQAAGNLLNTVVNNTGIIQAQTIENHKGVIKLLGDMQTGTVNVAGTLDASAPTGGDGGFIDSSAATVTVADDTRVTTAAVQGLTGSWLIDPTDYTIAATGGDITGAVLSANLANTDVIIESISGGTGTAGDVNVNDTVSWSANKLTLNAQNDININSDMNASGTASLALEFGQGAVAAGNTSKVTTTYASVNLPASTSNFTTRQGSDGSVKAYTVITSLGAAGSTTATDLQGINGNKEINYALGSDIDAGVTSLWNAGTGFAPIGDSPSPFTGTFDGLGHTIDGLFINRPSDIVGPFAYIGATAEIRNIGLRNVDITGGLYVGGLLGFNNGGSISNSYVTGQVVGGSNYIGGLVGVLKGSIHSSYATASVNGNGFGSGGLVGYSIGSISHSYATGQVAGSVYYTGGLVGANRGSISNSYASGTVTGSNHGVGGLAGINGQSAGDTGTISHSYATGNVSGAQNDVGGLVGANHASISDSYATGTVSADKVNAGGLVGIIYNGSISRSYATGAVNGPNAVTAVGGLVGRQDGGTISGSYWDSYSTGQTVSVAGAAHAGVSDVTSDPNQTAAPNSAFKQSAYTDINFTSDWFIVEGRTRPFLQSEYSTTIHNSHQLQLMAMDLAATYTLAANIDLSETGRAVNGVAPADASGMWSNAGFSPISAFSGSFDGRSHAIAGIHINLVAESYRGLFSFAMSASKISNVGLIGGSVNGESYSGSLVGRNEGTISNSYSTANVDGGGTSYAGGLVGWLMPGGTISNSYAAGTVAAGFGAGGLVGRNEGTITNSYASGVVTGAFGGGLTGLNVSGVVTDSFWNIDTTGRTTSTGGTGLTTAKMMQLASFSSWNDATPDTIANTGGSGAVWRIYEGHTAPLLRSFMTNLTLIGAPDLAVTYNGTTQSGAGISVPSGVLGAAATGTNVGFYNGYYSTQQGYDISGGNLTINAVPLTAISLNGTRAYDGTTDVVAGIFTLSGLVNGQDLNLTGTGTVGSKNVGTYTVSLGSLTLGDGASGLASNYTFAGGTHTATITKADLTVTGLSTASRIYDGTDVAVLGGTGAIAKFGADDVTLTGTVSGKFADKHVGLGKSVTVSGNSLEGADAGNYNLLQATGLTAVITKADLSLSASVITKTYDGGLSASGTATVSSGTVFDGDEISGGSFAFTDKNAGGGNKTVTVSGVTVADGNSGGNYSVSYANNTISTINPYAVSLTGSRIYDGTINVSAGALTIGALVGTETLTLSGAGTVADKHVANTRSLTLASLALGDGTNGGLASNYTFTGGTQTVDITPAALTLSTTDVSRVYDGTVTAAGTAIVSSGTLFGDDTFSGGSFAFTDKNVGSGNKTVAVSGVTVADGNNGGNYSVSYTNNATSTINPYAVSLTGSRIYDGTINVSAGALTIGALVGTETLTLSGAGTVADKHVANARSLTLASLALGDGTNGGLASNYTFTGGTQTANITPAALTLSATDVIKVYDGTVTAAGTAIVTDGTLFGDDTFSGGNFAFTDPNIGVGDKVVTVSGVAVADGNNGDNYNVSYADNTTSSIIEPVLSDASIILLQNSRATATSSGSASEASGANPALSGFSLARPGTSSLDGLDDILVSQGIRLPTDLQPGSADDDDDSDSGTN